MNQFPIQSTYVVANATSPSTPFVEVFENRAPTVNDINYPIQKRWYNKLSGIEYILVSFTSSNGVLSANWQPLIISSVATSYVTDSGTAVPALDILNINGGPGIQVIANPTGSNDILINMTDVANTYTNVTFAMSPYTVLPTDFFISVDSTLGPVTILLPNGPGNNREFVVKDRLGQSAINAITVTTPGGTDTIDGLTSYIFTDAYESIDVLFHGTNYEIF